MPNVCCAKGLISKMMRNHVEKEIEGKTNEEIKKIMLEKIEVLDFMTFYKINKPMQKILRLEIRFIERTLLAADGG
jgi:hypothetical protein